MTTLAQLPPAFETWLADAGRARTTQKTYGSHVRAFAHDIGAHLNPADLTTAIVRRYMTEFQKKHRPRSCHCVLYSLRSFGAFLVSEGYLQDNPAEGVEQVRLNESNRETPSDEEVIALIEACSRLRTAFRQCLTRAVLATLAFGGMRRAELLALRVADVNLKRGEIFLRHTKGGKSLTVCPAPAAIQALREWLEVRPRDAKTDRLFCIDRFRPLGDVGLRGLIRETAIAADMVGSKAILPHGLRHAYATRLLRKGADIKAISRALGHASIVTTEMYLHAGTDRLHEISHLSDLDIPGLTPSAPPKPARVDRRIQPAMPAPPRHRVSMRRP